MNCRQAKQQLALWVGDDLEAGSILLLERHIATCPCCRASWDELRSSREALLSLRSSSLSFLQPERARDDSAGEKDAAPVVEPYRSLWPAVSSRLPQRALPPLRRFNGWLPGFAVTVACVAVLAVAVRNMANSSYNVAADPLPVFQAMPTMGPRPMDATPEWEGSDFRRRPLERKERPAPFDREVWSPWRP